MANKSDWRADVLEALTAMFADDESVERGQMMGHPAFYTRNGKGKRKMFACVFGPGVALKLPGDVIDTLLEEPGHEPFTPMGHPMGGWLVASRDDAGEWNEEEELLRQAADHTGRG